MGIGTQLEKQKNLTALKLVQSSRVLRRLAKSLLLLLVLATIAMLFVPWQQSARGSGKVVAFVPQERQQTVTSPVKGVVVRVAEGLKEGNRVERGDVIIEIEPYAANLRDQLTAQIQDLKIKLTTANTKEEVYGRNVVDFEAARKAAVAAAEELIAAAKAKWDAENKLVPAYEAKELQARLNFQRQNSLAERGIKPKVEIEKLKKDWDVAKSELESLQLKIEAAKEEWDAKQDEREQKAREAKTKVDYARAMQQDALSQAATTQKEMRGLEIKLAELDRMTITAPRDGTIFRMPVFERGQTLKEGDALFTIVPDTTERVVELWVSGNDQPLIRQGDHVRLQFEGWPAVQFAGWPSVSVGTFGGEVAYIDPADDGNGKFRIQVRQIESEDWPSDNYLRQGVRANGWVMLREVTLGYEIWRQLNGFPPVVAPQEPGAKDDSKKKISLPK
ncbi:MAG: HlyD family secretion protein [Pirellulales bacterium]|nr:HlyD family secretion protein [Pirellulales bacterium]